MRTGLSRIAEGHEFVMNRLSLPVLGFIMMGVVFSSGCSLCCSPYTDDYLTHGSRTPRSDMKHGRVGSILSEPAAISREYSTQPQDDLEYGMESDEEVVVENDSISLGTDR